MNTENELFGELHEQEENGLFGNEHRRQYEAQQEALCQPLVSSRACRFAEWLQENRWFPFYQGKWNYTFENGTSISEALYNKNYRKTTEELYAKFCQEHGY